MKRAEQLGLEGFLIKPVSPSMLLDAIMSAFGKESPAGGRRTMRRDTWHEGLEQIQGASLLVVEDNEINQQVAQEILEEAGLRVTLAGDGRQAVDAVKTANYHAVLMDVQMPVMDGYAATKMIRQYSRFDDLPIIAMTANAMAGDREKALEAGMNDHVAKPIDPDQLFSSLVRWVKPGVRGFVPHKPAPKPAKADKAKAGALPKVIQGLDIQEGLNRIGGNKELYRNLLVKLRDDYARAASEIETAFNNGETDEPSAWPTASRAWPAMWEPKRCTRRQRIWRGP